MRKRYRQLPLIIGGLAAVALGSVGFSAWVITGQNNAGTLENISISIGELQDKTLSITDIACSKKVVSYDCDGTSGSAVASGDSTNKENLTINFTFNIKGGSNLFSSGNTLATSAITGFKTKLSATAGNAHLTTALTNKLICIPYKLDTQETHAFSGLTEIYSNYSSLTDAGQTIGGAISSQKRYSYTPSKIDEKTIKITGSINFKWGQIFNYVNPTKLSDASILSNNHADLLNLKDVKWNLEITPYK